jgi:hypothetical protein
MAYPATGSPKTELLIDGTWTDVSDRVRAETPYGIDITRGRANEQARVSAQRATFNLNNRDGLFSNRNPLSTYYGLLPRGTQCRISAGTGDSYVRMPEDYRAGSDAVPDVVSTPDVASLDITGDIEIRADIWPRSWRPPLFQVIGAKYRVLTANRSWVFYLSPEGALILRWSTDGSTSLQASSTALVPSSSGRLSVKVTLDVVNGANKSVAFYTSDSIDGTYTQLGTTVTTAGNTSIFSGNAALAAGMGDDFGGIFSNGMTFQGRFYKMRVYNGIAGSVVANPDFSAQAVGATSFADSTGKTWTVAGRSRVTSDRVRFLGELSALPQRWDKTGVDVWSPVTASGMIRRLTQGASPLSSPLYRALSQRVMTGWWPLEDGSSSTSAASAVEGTRAATTTKIQFADLLSLPGTKVAASFIDSAGKFIGTPKTTATTGTAYFVFYFRLPSLPVSKSTFVTLTTNGTARKINISVTATTFVFDFLDNDGTVLDTGNVNFGTGMTPTGQWLAMSVLLETSGGNISWRARWTNVAAETFVGVGPNLFAGTPGRYTNVVIGASASSAFTDAGIAHVHTATSDLDFVDYAMAAAANGYLGEPAGTRASRLADEEGVSLEVIGDPAQTETMGYQTPETFMDLLYECADADQGQLGESRDSIALSYRTRVDLGNRLDATLDYDAEHLSEVPEPTEDDQGITNDVTVTRLNGSSGRRQIDSGPMSVLDPPDGIGRYSTEVTLNLELDNRLEDAASWIANIGTSEEARYPSLAVSMHRSVIENDALLTATLAALDTGGSVSLADLPSWLPPDDVLLLVQGYSERLGKRLWDVTFNTTPATLFNIGRYDYTTIAGVTRYDHSTSTLNAGVNSTATTIVLAANSSTPFTPDVWTSVAGSYPFDIMIAGEQITLTQAPTGSTSPQTFNNVTRSVNGIVKSLPAGARARLARVAYWRL